jgi:cell division protein FtsB
MIDSLETELLVVTIAILKLAEKDALIAELRTELEALKQELEKLKDELEIANAELLFTYEDDTKDDDSDDDYNLGLLDDYIP